jgi:hypothetical protein
MRPTGNWSPARAERDCALALPLSPDDLPPEDMTWRDSEGVTRVCEYCDTLSVHDNKSREGVRGCE